MGVEVAYWTGAIDTDWHIAGNWNTGVIPTIKTHVIIPAGTVNECIISVANATAASIRIKTGASVKAHNARELNLVGKC